MPTKKNQIDRIQLTITGCYRTLRTVSQTIRKTKLKKKFTS